MCWYFLRTVLDNSNESPFKQTSNHWSEYTYHIYCMYSGQTGLNKQCRPRWDAREHDVSSGATLFATETAILDTSGSKVYLFKF